MVEQKTRAVDAPVVIEPDRLLHLGDGLVRLVVLLALDRGIKPRGGIVRIELLRQIDVTPGIIAAVLETEGFAKVTVKGRPKRFDRGRGLEVPAALCEVATADLREP